MSTFLIRPILSYSDVHDVLNSALVNMTMHGPQDEEWVSPYAVFQAVAAAMQVVIRDMTDNVLEEVTFRQI